MTYNVFGGTLNLALSIYLSTLIPSTQRVMFQVFTQVSAIMFPLLLDCIRGTTCLSAYVTRHLLSSSSASC